MPDMSVRNSNLQIVQVLDHYKINSNILKVRQCDVVF